VLFRDTVVYLRAVHPGRAVVVEHQTMEAQNATHRDRRCVEHLRIAVRIDDGIPSEAKSN
jgi:hypothetical protein